MILTEFFSLEVYMMFSGLRSQCTIPQSGQPTFEELESCEDVSADSAQLRIREHRLLLDDAFEQILVEQLRNQVQIALELAGVVRSGRSSRAASGTCSGRGPRCA